MATRLILVISFLFISLSQQALAQTNPQPALVNATQATLDFYAQVMNAPAVQPADLSFSTVNTHLPVRNQQGRDYLSAAQVDYARPYWEKRIARDWQFFSAPQQQGKILVINFAALSKNQPNTLSYRYLANDASQDSLFEPWSASKVMAYTAAVAKVRQLSQGKIGAMSLAGTTPIADMLTSIHSYEAFGQANGDSNALASYFVNLAGRDRLTALFHDQWLMLSNSAVRFRGGYANQVFTPQTAYWQKDQHKIKLDYPTTNAEALDYQTYRCQHCGLTGNKPMTTLALAEWLKRLAAHDRESQTRHPFLHSEDIEVLFYGKGHSDSQHTYGGMMQGISLMLHNALAAAISGKHTHDTKQVLDQATKGQWRIWQKIGWGPSETRGTGENVVLAHVSLPHFQGGMEFTLAAQTAELGNSEISVSRAGQKMQALLTQSIKELFKAN
ncbi:hypothetical protein [Paraglaciecola aestuariivivens]